MSKSASPRRVGDKEALAVGAMIRGSAYKLNLVAGLIRGKKVEKALADLTFSKRRIAGDVKKCLQSAIANAENNHNLDVDSLIVAEAWVGKNLVMVASWISWGVGISMADSPIISAAFINLLHGIPFLAIVCGEVNSGKSSLINGLFNEELCEVNALPETKKVLWYQWGEQSREIETEPMLEEQYRAHEFLNDFQVIDVDGPLWHGHGAVDDDFAHVRGQHTGRLQKAQKPQASGTQLVLFRGGVNAHAVH